MHKPTIWVALVGFIGLSPAGAESFLAIPDRGLDLIRKYDIDTGVYLGDFAEVPLLVGTTATPLNAAQGPDGYIYVTDQVQNIIFRYDLNGTNLGQFANGADGINNIRGLDFRGDRLYVASGDDYCAVFDLATGNRLANYFADGEPYDIFFLDDGRAIVSEILGSDEMFLYAADGLSRTLLFASSPTGAIPEQINARSNGNFVVAETIGDEVVEFALDGSIVNSFAFDGVRGVHELTSGNLLVSGGLGLYVVDAESGAIVSTIDELADSNFIELVVDPDDIRMFAECLAGPDRAPAPTIVGLSAADCRSFFDADADDDVDLADYAAFQR